MISYNDGLCYGFRGICCIRHKFYAVFWLDFNPHTSFFGIRQTLLSWFDSIDVDIIGHSSRKKSLIVAIYAQTLDFLKNRNGAFRNDSISSRVASLFQCFKRLWDTSHMDLYTHTLLNVFVNVIHQHWVDLEKTCMSE